MRKTSHKFIIVTVLHLRNRSQIQKRNKNTLYWEKLKQDKIYSKNACLWEYWIHPKDDHIIKWPADTTNTAIHTTVANMMRKNNIGVTIFPDSVGRYYSRRVSKWIKIYGLRICRFENNVNSVFLWWIHLLIILILSYHHEALIRFDERKVCTKINILRT